MQLGIFPRDPEIFLGIRLAGVSLHKVGQPVHALLGFEQLGIRGKHLLTHRAAALGGYLKRAVLRKYADRCVLIYIHAARGRLRPAEQEREQCGFAAPVGADDAEAVVLVECE